jgi:hypothetical protein
VLIERVSLFSMVAGLIVTPALALHSGTYAGESEDGGVLELKLNQERKRQAEAVQAA